MTNLIKSSFVWQFAAGFVLGAIGLAAANASEIKPAAVAAPTHVAR